MRKSFIICLFCLGFIAASAVAYAQNTEGESFFGFSQGGFTGKFYGYMYGDFFYQWTEAGGGEKSKNEMFRPIFTPSSAVGIDIDYAGKLTGEFELGANFTSLYNAIRYFWVQYKFDNGGYLKLGKQKELVGYYLDQMSDDENGLAYWGTIVIGKRIMLQYAFKNFHIALVDSYFDTGIVYIEEKASYFSGSSSLQYIPRLEAAYTYEDPVAEFKLAGAYGYYMARSGGSVEKDYGVHSATFTANTKINIGKAYIKLFIFYGLNSAMSGNIQSELLPEIIAASGEKVTVRNVHSFSASVGAGYSINKQFMPQAGVGYMGAFGEQFKKSGGESGIYQNLGVYVNTMIKINRWISLYPEVDYLSNLDNGYGKKGQTRVLAGIHALVSF